MYLKCIFALFSLTVHGIVKIGHSGSKFLSVSADGLRRPYLCARGRSIFKRLRFDFNGRGFMHCSRKVSSFRGSL